MPDEREDDIAETLIEGDTYEQAALSVSRMVPISLDMKIRLAIGVLALSATIGPAVFLRRDLVREFEGVATLELGLGLLALNGIVTAFVGGLLLVRQQYVVQRQSLTARQARKLVRFEDLFVLAVLFGGLLIAVPVVFATVGLLSPPAIETLYAHDIRVYRPDNTIGLDLRLISGIGTLFAGVLFSFWWSAG